MRDQPGITARERQTLASLRYAVNEEAATYLAIMRLFTTGMSGFLSDQSAAEVVERLAEQGVDLDVETVEPRLAYLVEHGNLTRSPRETEARSVREYLANRSRYQLTQRGELVHRQVEELLQHTDTAREVSSEMLPGILVGLEELHRVVVEGRLAEQDPRETSARISTVFAQFELLVSSTRQFYTYLSQVLTRFDLGREEFRTFKEVLLDYLQRFVDEISRHVPQLAEVLTLLAGHVPALVAHSNEGQRLVAVDGTTARRAPGLEASDWESLHAWFVGTSGRRGDAENVRRLATDAMRALLVNLRRIAAGADREQSRYADFVSLARWFDSSDDRRAHDLWAATFGLYPARHLAFAADDDADPVPATASWWQSPVAEVPVSLRRSGERRASGRTGARVDYSAAKQARLAERQQAHERHVESLRELVQHGGVLDSVYLSNEARTVLLELHARALSGHGRPLEVGESARVEVPLDGGAVQLTVSRAVGEHTVVTSPAGRITLKDLRLGVAAAADATGYEWTVKA